MKNGERGTGNGERRRLICIECPQGCALSVAVKGGGAADIKGAKCPKGKAYAIAEITFPVRMLTSTVRAKGMDLRYVPVRTDRPIPRADIDKAMKAIKGLEISRPVVPGSVVAEGIGGTPAKLIATRRAGVI